MVNKGPPPICPLLPRSLRIHPSLLLSGDGALYRRSMCCRTAESRQQIADSRRDDGGSPAACYLLSAVCYPLSAIRYLLSPRLLYAPRPPLYARMRDANRSVNAAERFRNLAASAIASSAVAFKFLID